MPCLKLSVCAFLCAFALSSPAQMAPQQDLWRRARLMPMGQSQFGWSSGYLRARERLDRQGQVSRLGAPYTQPLSLGDLWKPEELSSQNRRMLENLAQDQGFDLNSVAAVTEFDLTQQEMRMNGHWSYGLRSFWMIGLRVPLIYRQTEVRVQSRATENLRQLQRSLEKTHPHLKRSMRSDLKQTTIDRLENLGYDPLSEESQDLLLGDVELLSKVRLYDGRQLQAALRQRVSLPTASAPRPYQFIENEAGDGQLDFGLDHLLDFQLTSRILLTHQVGYLVQFPDQRSFRTRDAGSALLVEREVQRDLGDVISSSLFIEYSLLRRWTLLSGYSFRWKAEDRYRGDLLPNEVYQQAALDSSQELHMSHLGVGYEFLRTSSLPVQANFYVSSVMGGKGVLNTSVAQLDLLFYY